VLAKRTWPFAAVFEYDGTGQPEAYIDWFRRARGNKSPSAWFLDPSIDYVDHINREMVNDHGARWSYMAVPDTPTSGYVGTAEFAIRARVRWADGRRAQLGWWLWFDAPRGKSVDDWQVEQTPLVDWKVTRSSPKLGTVATADVDDLGYWRRMGEWPRMVARHSASSGERARIWAEGAKYWVTRGHHWLPQMAREAFHATLGRVSDGEAK